MSQSLREYCARYDRGELLLQWHGTKNGTLDPQEISYGSHRPVWWNCDRGHEWQSPPYARVGRNAGCPYCAGKRAAPGLDLGSQYPLLAREWHPVKNGPVRPEDCLPGSHRSVWWRCERGHEWKAVIKSRVGGNGCPVCSNRRVITGENDLATLAPTLAAQWHPEKNGALTPEQVSAGSDRRVWWRCSRGHEWQASAATRTAGRGCPVCAGRVVVPGENDLQSYDPELAKQWHPTKNDRLTPEQVAVSSNKKVWWRCERGHEWLCAVSVRTEKRSDCPYCANRKVLAGFNDLKTVQPLVAAQWHPMKNAPLEPDMVLPGSRARVWWRCTDGHEWKAVIYSRTGAKKSGCPVCAGKSAKRI